MKRILVVLAVLLGLAGAFWWLRQPNSAEQIRMEKIAATTQFKECDPWEGCWNQYFDEVSRAARRAPDNPILGEMYQGMLMRLGPETSNRTRQQAWQRAKDNSNNAFAQYLAAGVSVRGEQKLTYLTQAIGLDGEFCDPHLAMAQAILYPRSNQDKGQLETEYGSVESHLSLFMKLCPERAANALWFNEVGDVGFWGTHLPNPRLLLKDHELPKGQWPYVAGLKNLWALEARLYPAESKDRLMQDVESLTTLAKNGGYTLPILDGLTNAATRLEQFDIEKQLRDKSLQDFPCSSEGDNSWYRIVKERYWETHGGRKSPQGMTVDEAKEYYTTVRGWMKTCPQGVGLAMNDLLPTILRLQDVLSEEELEELESYYSDLWPRLEPYYRVYPPNTPHYVFPLIRLRRGLSIPADHLAKLEDLLLIRDSWEQDLLVKGWQEDELEKEKKEGEVYDRIVDLKINSLLAEVAVAVDETGLAQDTLSRQESGVQIVLQHRDLYGADTALLRYYIARAAVTESSWDAYAFLVLANAFQVEDASHIDYDSRLAAELTQAQQVLNTRPELASKNWKGSATGLAALQQAEKVREEKLAAAQKAKSGEWKVVAKPFLLPPFVLKTVDGRTVALADLKGKLVFINVWATWCPPCQFELPLLQKVAEALKDDTDIIFLSFNTDSDQGVVAPYLSKKKLSFPTVLLAEEYYRTLAQGAATKEEIQMLWPQSWTVDKAGRVTHIMQGFDSSQKPEAWTAGMITFLREQAKR